MNKNNTYVLQEFASVENKKYLASRLIDTFCDEDVTKFIHGNICEMVNHFKVAVERDLMMSEPLVKTSIYDQVSCLNTQFLHDRIAFIQTHILKESEKPLLFVVRDGAPTSRYSERMHQSSADNQLEMWRRNPTRGINMREDSHADVNADRNQFYNGQMETGVAFCDQSDLGTSRHVDAFWNPTMQSLNQGCDNSAFGHASPASDKRLLQRRIFRSNEQGIENGIPVYEQRLYRRNYERDTRESMPSYEHGCNVYKHDMQSLFKRIDEKNKFKRRYDS